MNLKLVVPDTVVMGAKKEDLRINPSLRSRHQLQSQPQLDCRTCFNAASHSCTSSVECDAGSQYRPRRPLQLWRGA
jgi:hypothetical protein